MVCFGLLDEATGGVVGVGGGMAFGICVGGFVFAKVGGMGF